MYLGSFNLLSSVKNKMLYYINAVHYILLNYIPSEVIIIVLNSFLEEAQKLMHEIFEDEMVLDFVGIPDSEYMETADSLREIKDKIKVWH